MTTKMRRVTLRELRSRTELTQTDVAKGMAVGQSEVSILERRDTLDGVQLGTLRRYACALGGELRLVVVLKDEQLIIEQE